MNIDKQMLKQLALTMERKVMTDEVKALDKQLRTLEKKITGLNENVEVEGDLASLVKAMHENMTELKKVLKANSLL